MQVELLAGAVVVGGLGGQRRAGIIEAAAVGEPDHGSEPAARQHVRQILAGTDVAHAQRLGVAAVFRRQIGHALGQAICEIVAEIDAAVGAQSSGIEKHPAGAIGPIADLEPAVLARAVVDL